MASIKTFMVAASSGVAVPVLLFGLFKMVVPDTWKVGAENIENTKSFAVKAGDTREGGIKEVGLKGKASDGYVKIFNEINCRPNMPLGAPVMTKNNPYLNSKSLLFCYKKYNSHYSVDTKTPMWVSYVLNKSDFRSNPYHERTNDFREDPQLLAFSRSASSYSRDYSGTNFDRGHVAPAADFSYNQQAMSESFYMTNMVPQESSNNRGIWANLESGVRKLFRQKNIDTLYVTSGVIFAGKTGSIGRGVKVPSHLFKAVLDPATGNSVAFLIPNVGAVSRDDYRQYSMTIEQLEKNIAMNLFPKLTVRKAEKNVELLRYMN